MGKLFKLSVFVAVVAALVFVGMRATETSSLFGRVRRSPSLACPRLSSLLFSPSLSLFLPSFPAMLNSIFLALKILLWCAHLPFFLWQDGSPGLFSLLRSALIKDKVAASMQDYDKRSDRLADGSVQEQVPWGAQQVRTWLVPTLGMRTSPFGHPTFTPLCLFCLLALARSAGLDHGREVLQHCHRLLRIRVIEKMLHPALPICVFSRHCCRVMTMPSRHCPSQPLFFVCVVAVVRVCCNAPMRCVCVRALSQLVAELPLCAHQGGRGPRGVDHPPRALPRRQVRCFFPNPLSRMLVPFCLRRFVVKSALSRFRRVDRSHLPFFFHFLFFSRRLD